MLNQQLRETLLLLVGSNPLPNYLAACALRPDSVALVYTEATKDAKERLKRVLKEVDANLEVREHLVEDAGSATTVRRAIDSLLDSASMIRDHTISLNYTGGTKVMAAHARMAFQEKGGQTHLASYLDEGGVNRRPCLRFDDGTDKALAKYDHFPMSLATALKLHGLTHKPREQKAPAPTVGDAREILCKVLQDVVLAGRLYCERQRCEEYANPSKATATPFRAADYGLGLSLSEFPTDELLNSQGNRNQKESWFKQWYKFIGGEWLEEWLGAQIHALNLSPSPEITVGVNAFRGERKTRLEVDVAVIRGYRSHFISCTTDVTKSICKSKLFEVAVRARQLGGDLARAALVCLADDKTVSELQEDIDDVWGASNTTKVFGLSDIRTWSDCDDKQPNLYALRAWLES